MNPESLYKNPTTITLETIFKSIPRRNTTQFTNEYLGNKKMHLVNLLTKEENPHGLFDRKDNSTATALR